MSLADIDNKTVLMAVMGSLIGYVFYGFIELSAKVDTMETKQAQIQSEQRDLWDKYNADQQTKFDFAVKFYEYKLSQEERWKDYYKENKR